MLERLGLFGLFLGCMLSATVIPFSSEALLAGALLLDYPTWLVILVASLGNTAGGMISFALGWFCKWSWIEKCLKVKEESLEKARQKVEKYGVIAALFTWLPFVGDAIAIAMGLMRIRPFWTAVLMFVGKAARYVVVAGAVGMVAG